MKVYRTGYRYSDKHIEIIICQMLRKVIVVDGGDTELIKDTTISKSKITEINDAVLERDGNPAKFKPMLLGISKSSVETDSWLSAASFQETTKVLTNAAVRGKVDDLIGLKETSSLVRKFHTGSDVERETTTMVNEMAEEMIKAKNERLAIVAEKEAEKGAREGRRMEKEG